MTLEEEGSDAFAEFQHEVFIMSCLRHKNIVQLMGICLQPLAMLMEFLPLGTLYDALQAREVWQSRKMRLKTAFDIALGMQYLHSVMPPIIHRDLRSPNILMASFSEHDAVVAKVADFGLSRVLGSTMVGGEFNPHWVSPEILNEEEYSTPSDVYSFGIICWEIATQRRPFEDYDDQFRNPFEFKEAIISGLRPSVRENHGDPFVKMLQRCWTHCPMDRPSFSAIVAEVCHTSNGILSYMSIEGSFDPL